MQLMPGAAALGQVQVDYAQSVLENLGPPGRIVAALQYDDVPEDGYDLVAGYVDDLVHRMKASGQSEEALADVLLVAVRFDRTSSDAWNEGVFRTLLLPALRAFAACDMWWAVQRLCRLIGFITFHGARSDAYVQAILSGIEDALADELARWPRPETSSGRLKTRDGLSVAIVTDFRLADLSGIRILINFLEAYQRRFGQRDRIRLVIEQSALTDASAPHRARLEAAGVSVVPYDRAAADRRTPIGFGNLASVCAGLDLDVVVLYCSYSFALLAAWCRLAPLQAFWSVSFDAAPSRQFDLLLSSSAAADGSRSKTIAGRRWLVIPPIYEIALHDPAPVRRDGPYAAFGRPLFATVGGIQKIDNDDFMTMLARLLDALPGAAFLWTSAVAYPQFDERARRFGIVERCHNVGFVDIDLFAPQIDVHLDGFPYGTAVAAMRMLAFGCPTVSMAVKESLFGYIYNPLLTDGLGSPERLAGARDLLLPPDATPRLLVAESIDQYVALAVRVARDPDYRAACAAAYRTLFADLLGDGGYAAEAWRAALTAGSGPA